MAEELITNRDILVTEQLNVTENVTENTTQSSGTCKNNVNDIVLDKSYRLIILYITICLCLIGSIFVVLWMVFNKRISHKFNHPSRVNAFILNLTVADILVIFLAVLPQLIWEYMDREWLAGPAMCRIVKFLQSFSIMSSNYMLAVIAVDRHQAICLPLKGPISVLKMAGTGWISAIVLSLPVLGVFHTITRDNTILCENIFRPLPMHHRQIWMTFVFIAVFVIPCVTLVTCYTRIFLTISKKATERNNLKFKPGKVCLQSTHSSSLPKAKLKTLKMTFVIVVTFIVCMMPFFIIEMIMTYGDHCIINKKVYAILGGMAACNSATNPYVFLSFNIKLSCIRQLKQCGKWNKFSRGYFWYNNTSCALLHHAVVLNPTVNIFVKHGINKSNIEMKNFNK